MVRAIKGNLPRYDRAGHNHGHGFCAADAASKTVPGRVNAIAVSDATPGLPLTSVRPSAGRIDRHNGLAAPIITCCLHARAAARPALLARRSACAATDMLQPGGRTPLGRT